MKKYLAALLFLPLMFTACAVQDYLDSETAMRLATPAFMVKRQVPAGQFGLMAFERMHKRHAPANVYIEGDGTGDILAPSPVSPTPSNPVGLHLASKDNADNVVYLARPCQFLSHKETAQCDPQYWNASRFSPEVIAAYNAALDEIAERYNIQGYNLIGFGGGGAIAAILAADRDDVRSLRTVAGNLDTDVFAQIHHNTNLSNSLNPANYAEGLKKVPQYHFASEHNSVVPPAILESYLAKVPSPCVFSEVQHKPTHDAGWVNQWPELLKKEPKCVVEHESVRRAVLPPNVIPNRPRPVYRPREKDLEKEKGYVKP